MLGNLRPLFRSSLKSIQLLCILNASFIQKYGSNNVLQPFMNNIMLLEKVCIFNHFQFIVNIALSYRMKGLHL